MQHGGRQSDAGELGHAEMSDDRRIREEEQRFGNQRTEGRDREAQDLPPAARRGRERGGSRGRGRHGTTLTALPASHSFALVDFSSM